MGIHKSKRDAPLTDKGDLYLPGDFRKGADAVEKDTDSAWDLFQEAQARHNVRFADTSPASTVPPEPLGDRRYARTVPAGLGASTPKRPRQRAAQPATLEDAMVEARRNNRVCPQPERWHQLFDMLPAKQRDHPAQPLTGDAWLLTPSLSKRMCLREQLDWASGHGQLDAVLTFLRGLREDEWLHMGE